MKIYQNFWDVVEVMHGGKFIALRASIRKKKLLINNVNTDLKKLGQKKKKKATQPKWGLTSPITITDINYI